jgi:hypothetical protein
MEYCNDRKSWCRCAKAPSRPRPGYRPHIALTVISPSPLSTRLGCSDFSHSSVLKNTHTGSVLANTSHTPNPFNRLSCSPLTSSPLRTTLRIHAGHYDMNDAYDERYREYLARLSSNVDRTAEL